MTTSTRAWCALASTLFCAACSNHDPPGDGFLLITVVSTGVAGTPLADVTSIQITGQRIDVVHRSDCTNAGTERVLTLLEQPFTVVINAQSNVPERLTQLAVPAGCVEEVRVIANGLAVTRAGGVVMGKIPSGPQTGIKVKPSGAPPQNGAAFPIVASKTTAIRVDFDANAKLVFNQGQGVLEKPVLDAVQVDTELSLGVILDEIVLTFDPGTPQLHIDTVVAGGGGTIEHQYPPEFVTVKLSNTGELRDRLNYFLGQPHVRVALPNTWLDTQGPNPFPLASGDPSDPFYAEMPTAGFERANLDAVHARDAWTVTTGSTDVVMAVVDSGFDVLHEELIDNLWINEGEIPAATLAAIDRTGPECENGHITFRCLNSPANVAAGVCPMTNSDPIDRCDPLDILNGQGNVYGWQDTMDNDGNTFPDDFIGWDFNSPGIGDNLPEPPSSATNGFPPHGTAVAGIAVGAGNNGVASPGVAWHARVMLLRGAIVANPPGTSFRTIIGDRVSRDSFVRALVYAHENGAKVINTSLGSAITRDDGLVSGCEDRGVHFVPVDKFNPGLQALATEWEMRLGALTDRAVLTVAMNDCGGEDADLDGDFFYPGGYTIPRPDIGVAYFDPTMITVASVTVWDLINRRVDPSPDFSSFSELGPRTVLIAAPGDNWRILDARQYPVTGTSTATMDCFNPDSPSSAIDRCRGTSFAAPMVAGAAALTLANQPALNAAALKARILDNATDDSVGIGGRIEGNRLLNVAAAVGP